MLKCKILILAAAFAITAQSQDSIPDIEILFSSIDTFYNQKLESELKAFESNPKDYWMNFVPSVGVAYTPSGAPRPSISYSLNSLFQVRQQKRQVAAMRESIVLKNRIERQATKLEAAKLLQQIEILKEDLLFSIQIHDIDIQLFEFYEKQNLNNEIRPSEFLIKKKDFLNKQQKIRLEEREIKILTLELLKTSYLKF